MIQRNFSIAAMGIYYKQDHFLKKWLDNLYPYVDKIYIGYSEKAWGYITGAKEFDDEPDDFQKILEIYPDNENKIIVIEGVWKLEEDERNTVLEHIRKDGFDYCMIIDLDEFASYEFFQKVYHEVEKERNINLWKVPWVFLWKTEEYVVADKGKNPWVGYPEFILKCDNSYRFKRARIPDVPVNESSIITIPEYEDRLIHYSYCVDDIEMLRKVNTWGHAHQFNASKWLKKKWYKNPSKVKNIHPVTPKIWPCVIKREFTVKIK